MTEEKKAVPAFRLLCLIADPKAAEKAKKLFQEGNIPLQYQFHGYGSASSEIMDLLGLGNIDKIILVSMMPRPMAEILLKKLSWELNLRAVSSGIAFTVPLSGGNARLLKMLENIPSPILEEERKMADAKYALIAAVADRGYSEEVMTAARAAGAAGGTVIPSRRIVNEDTMKFWGLSIHQEKEIILILTDSGKKMDIMRAVSEKCGLGSEAKGIILSLPVDSVVGLAEPGVLDR